MRCPFDYKRPHRRYSFGVAWEFMDHCEESYDREETALNEKYPTCWAKFLHWLGWH